MLDEQQLELQRWCDGYEQRLIRVEFCQYHVYTRRLRHDPPLSLAFDRQLFRKAHAEPRTGACPLLRSLCSPSIWEGVVNMSRRATMRKAIAAVIAAIAIAGLAGCQASGSTSGSGAMGGSGTMNSSGTVQPLGQGATSSEGAKGHGWGHTRNADKPGHMRHGDSTVNRDRTSSSSGATSTVTTGTSGSASTSSESR